MNIAYLIIAWNQPDMLRRMVDRLNQPNVHFYIHIDKKNKDIQTYRDLFSGDENVTVLWEYKVYWGGFSQVKTQLYLLGLACNSPLHFKYCIFLSGQDYPIKTNLYINDFFNTHSCDFLSYNKIEHLPSSFKDKYRYFHYLDFKYINPKDPHKSNLLYYLYRGFYNRMGKFLPERSFYKNFTPFFGSDWLALTKESAQFILDFATKNKDYVRFMKYTEIPSELFIHNILLNSARKTNVSDYDKYEEWLKTRKEGDLFMPEYSSLRYMDWSDKGMGAGKPAFLDESYFETLREDKNLFARKVDVRISAELLNRIDTELLDKNK